MSSVSLQNLDTIILCGGLGTRLRPVVADVPKALAPIAGRPFLNILLSYLKQQRIRRVILAIGYGGDAMRSRYADGRILSVAFSEETKPLGTGGAFKQALALAKSDHVLVLNGDTFCPVRYHDFLNFHLAKNASLSMVVAKADRGDVGGITLHKDGSIAKYEERATGGAHPFMSAGIYLMERAVAAHMPEQDAFSLERDFFPAFVARARCFGYVTQAPIIDIGTPERYRGATSILGKFA